VAPKPGAMHSLNDVSVPLTLLQGAKPTEAANDRNQADAAAMPAESSAFASPIGFCSICVMTSLEA
jgi:hypothetical protein